MSYLSNSPNHALASLPPDALDLLQGHFRHVELRSGKVLFNPYDLIEHAYFPDSGVVSLVVGFEDGRFVEAGMVGRNSNVGGFGALDGPHATNRAIVQVPGFANVIDIASLRRLAAESEPIRLMLSTHEHAISTQTQQVAGCNAVHLVEERLSRWLLQTRDLIGSDELPLTQEFLSNMLGVQRTSVTLIAKRLQESGFIKYRRGHITILDVVSLHDSACECYGAINRHFARLIRWGPEAAQETHMA